MGEVVLGASENNRKAKFYQLTVAGRKQLSVTFPIPLCTVHTISGSAEHTLFNLKRNAVGGRSVVTLPAVASIGGNEIV